MHPVPDYSETMVNVLMLQRKKVSVVLPELPQMNGGPDGINANIICPLAWTAQLENFQQAYPEAFEANVKMPPAGHYGDVEKEIGRVCVQLASPDFKYMNGETLTLEGGMGFKAVTRHAEDRMYFLPLASFYISYMKNMRRRSFDRSSPHFYAFRYFILFTNSDRLFFIAIIFHPLGVSRVNCRCIFFFCLDLRICFYL